MFLNYSSFDGWFVRPNSIYIWILCKGENKGCSKDSDVIYMNSGDQHAGVLSQCRLGTFVDDRSFQWRRPWHGWNDDCSNNAILSALASLWRHFLSQMYMIASGKYMNIVFLFILKSCCNIIRSFYKDQLVAITVCTFDRKRLNCAWHLFPGSGRQAQVFQEMAV
jgi:hypothetical protein